LKRKAEREKAFLPPVEEKVKRKKKKQKTTETEPQL
jgi:hypothetical protein